MNFYEHIQTYVRDNRVPIIAMGVIFLTIVYFARNAVAAWEDAIKLDREERGFFQRMVEPLVSRMAPQTEVAERQLRMLLQQAGLRDEGAMHRFGIIRLSTLVGGVVLAILYDFTGADLTQSLGAIALMLIIGFKAPDVWLNSAIAERQGRIAHALPNMIDLMVLCLDVGLSVEAAFERVATEMRSMEPLMAEEASLMVSEVGAGFTFPQALRRMADRIGLEDLITLSRLINQAAQLGASIATALREYSDASFQKRMLTLEENAGKISSMMVLPVTCCMLPAAMLALIGPAILMLSKSFMKI